MSDGKAFFAELDKLPDAKARGDSLRRQLPEHLMKWQQESVSECSPGPVKNEETLRLALYEGRQVEAGKLNRLAFAPLEKLGLSTDRCNYASLDESQSRAQRKAARDQKPAWGYVEMSADYLRQLTVTGDARPAVGIYDTAQPQTVTQEKNLAHAEAFLLYKTSDSVPRKSVQANMMDAYRPHIQPWATADDIECAGELT